MGVHRARIALEEFRTSRKASSTDSRDREPRQLLNEASGRIFINIASTEGAALNNDAQFARQRTDWGVREGKSRGNYRDKRHVNHRYVSRIWVSNIPFYGGRECRYTVKAREPAAR